MRYGSQSCHATARIQATHRTIIVPAAAAQEEYTNGADVVVDDDDDHKPTAGVAIRATTTTTAMAETAAGIAVKLLYRCAIAMCGCCWELE
jgi:hypothetical protein